LINKNAFYLNYFWLLFVFNELDIFYFIYNKYRLVLLG